jgi:anti-sigma factor ChrR (cupin superfamily)
VLSCHDLANKVASDYVDSQLRWHERAKVRLHLAICDNCRRFIKQLKLVRTVIRQREPAPADTTADAQLQQLAAQLHATAQQKKNSS